MSLSWGSPYWLAALAAIPIFLWWLSRGRASAVPIPAAGALREGRGRWIRIIPHLPTVLRVLALAALIVALARPRTPGEVIEDPRAGIPVVVAIDLSSSMLAEDFRPRDRLQVAKQTVAAFVASRADDPIGIVAFAGEAITVAPVTTYRPVVLNALRGLEVGLLEDGTAIGDGLAIAVNRLRELPGRERVVVLMSDGESNRGQIDPVDAARAAAAFGVRVFTIGVGSEGVARVPVERAEGGLVYAELTVGLDEELLQEIATLTGGRYFRATNPQALREIYGEIDRLVATPQEERRRVLFQEWYLPLLLLAGTLLTVEWGVRGSRWGVVPG
jgi:Ca-activated chloride channel family protein